jgi:hypothetical protein
VKSWTAILTGLCLGIIRAEPAQAAPASAPATRGADEFTRESADLLVSRYLSALAELDEKTLLGIMQFETTADRNAFREWLSLAKLAGEGFSWDRSKTKYQVSLRHKRTHSVAQYLVPQKQGYVPMTFIMVSVAGRPKIRYSDESAGAREKSAAQLSIDSAKKAIRSWQDAQGEALKEKATDWKDQLQDRIAALSMAKDKGLRLVAGSGTVEEEQQAYDLVKSLSDTELRSLMIGRLERELARLVPNTQPS